MLIRNAQFIYLVKSILKYPLIALSFAVTVSISGIELNVSRNFSSTEEPEFMIYGNTNGPVYIRLYEIKNPEEFLSGQKDPHTATLPSKRVSSGGSAMWKSFSENVKWSLYAGARRYMRTDKREELRKALNLKTYAYPFEDRFPARNLFEPLRYPLVKEITETPRRQYGWFNRMIKPGKLNPGFYLIEVSQGRSITFSPIIISDLVLLTKEGENSSLAWGVDMASGQLSNGAKLSTYKISDKGLVKISSEVLENGIWSTKSGKPDKQSHQTIYMLEKDNHYALSETYFYRNQENVFRTAIYTERPVYRAGNEVFFKGIVMRYNSGKLSPVQGEHQVTVHDTNKKKLFSKKILFSKFGTFNASLVLPENSQPGTYAVEVTVQNKTERGFFAVEQYKKPVFKVEMSSEKTFVSRGEANTVSLQANYYSGEAIQNAKVTYDIQRKTISYPWWYGFEYSWYYEEDWDYGYWENIKSGEATTDQNGHAKISFSAPQPNDKEPYDYTYRVTASVTSKTRDVITSSSQFKVVRSEYSMRLTQDRWFYNKSERAEIQAELRAWLGNQPMSGVSVEGEVFIISYDSSNQSNKREKITTIQAKSNADGIASLVLPAFKTGGTYEVKVSATDSRRGKVTEIMDFWVSTDTHNFSSQTEGKITLTPDKTKYTPGDTALFLVNTSVKKGKILITFETSDILHHEILDIENLKTGVKLPVSAEYMPNIKVTANAFEKKEKWILHSGFYDLVLPPVQNFMKVELLTDRESFRPGEKGKFIIKISDHKGVPVQGEYSLAVVDEPVFAIKSEFMPDLTRALYPRNNLSVSTTNSLNYRFYGNSREAELYTKMIADRDRILAKFKGEKQQITIRKNFKDTAFWLAQGKTDARGIAHISLDFPDNLTSWRFTAHAVGPGGLVGTGRKNIKVSKDFSLRLATPRFLREKDKISLGLIISNQLKQNVTADIKINASGINLRNDYSKKVSLNAGNEKRIDFTALADTLPKTGNALLTVTANVPGIDSDGIELPLPILPYGVEQILTESISLDNKETNGQMKLTLPKIARNETAVLTVSYMNGVLASVYETLPYLINYPYGCVEQTLSNFVPAMWAKKMSARWKISLPVNEDTLEEITSTGLERLYSYQHSDGGWGWWSDDPTHPYMTAYVLDGFKQAMINGTKIKPDVLNKGLESLKQQISAPNADAYFRDSADFVKAYQYYVLSLFEKMPPDFSSASNELLSRNKENSYLKALVALSAHNWKQKKKAADITNEILGSAGKSSQGISFTKGNAKASYWYNDDQETTAFVIEALLQINRKKALKTLPEAIKFLMLKKQDRRWRSTKTSAMVTKAFSTYAMVTGEKPQKTKVKMSVNNDMREFSFNPAEYKSDDVGAIFKLNTRTAEIEITRQGKGFFLARADWKYYKGGEIIPPQETAFTVTRKYYRLQKSGEYMKKETSDSMTFKAGDLLISETQVSLPERSEYLLTEDFLPSGFEVVEGEALNTLGKIHDWDSYFTNKTRLDDRVGISRTYSHGKTWRSQVILRAVFPGQFQAMPAQAGLMYFPESMAHSSGNVLRIVE